MKLDKYLQEAPVVSFQKYDDPDSVDAVEYDDVEDELEQGTGDDVEWDDDETTDSDTDGGQEWDDDEETGEMSDPSDPESDEEEQPEGEDDPDRQGMIRTVPDAHLVYKRKDEHNQYTELWIFKQDYTTKMSSKTYDAIIAGTDIPKGRNRSEDGTQTVEAWEIGPPTNTLIFVEIKGLTN
jgi:hypothetical protein